MCNKQTTNAPTGGVQKPKLMHNKNAWVSPLNDVSAKPTHTHTPTHTCAICATQAPTTPHGMCTPPGKNAGATPTCFRGGKRQRQTQGKPLACTVLVQVCSLENPECLEEAQTCPGV